MNVQKKLYPVFSRAFWHDLDASISYLVRDLLMGRDVARVARELQKAGLTKCTDSLLYKWANPNDERLPSTKALLLLIKVTENCEPIEQINEACGLVAVPDNDAVAAMRLYAAHYEKREKMRGTD
jgi:hypothetical protein